MLFNSYEFLFLFLPIVLGGYFFFGGMKGKSRLANVWLVLASLFFYSYWNVKYLPLLLASIGLNYLISGYILRYRKAKMKGAAQKAFWLGIVFNAGLLGFYKYTDFFIENLDLLGANLPLLHIILPLGISFFTITQMVFLVDCYEGVAKERNLIDYALFVSFFPHLLAGPILYHKSMMKQFADEKLRWVDWENMARGFVLFVIGLAKKVIIADSFVKYVGIGYDNDTSTLTFFDAWLTALCYMTQLFFDFSGYSDMAVGLARMMNIKIPINFNSPYRAYGIIDFWSRFHMSLTTTITNYLYTPMVMNCKKITFPKAMLATFSAMFIAGIWHGAGWTFVVFGAIHGMGLVVNHVWKKFHFWMWRPLGYALTLLTVLIGDVFFRAKSIGDALNMLTAMTGANGFLWHPKVADFLNNHLAFSLESNPHIYSDFPKLAFMSAILLVAFVPSSNEIIKKLALNRKIAWAVGIILAIIIMLIRDKDTEFIYFQF